jgi:hypothetical protein
MSDDILYQELFDGERPPKPNAWKGIVIKDLPDIDELCKGASTGKGDSLIKQIETDDWITALAQGAPAAMTEKASTLLSDDFFNKSFLDSNFVLDLLKSQSVKKAEQLDKRAKYKGNLSTSIKALFVKQGFRLSDEDAFADLIDHAAEYVAEAVANA